MTKLNLKFALITKLQLHHATLLQNYTMHTVVVPSRHEFSFFSINCRAQQASHTVVIHVDRK